MRGQYRKMLPFSLPWIRKNGYGIWLPEKSLGSQKWTGIARPNNPFTKEA